MAGAPGADPNLAAGSGGGGKLLSVLTLVNFVVTLGMVAILLISFQRDRQKPTITDISAQVEGEGHGEAKGGAKPGAHGEEKKAGPSFGKMVTLDQFTVNLSTPGSANPKYVRANISVEVPSDDAEAEVNSKMPQIRNAIIDLFNSKRPSDLATADGREYLKDEIKNALNSFLVTGKVTGVFFTSFAVAG